MKEFGLGMQQHGARSAAATTTTVTPPVDDTRVPLEKDYRGQLKSISSVSGAAAAAEL
jgi:hypothetical protein